VGTIALGTVALAALAAARTASADVAGDNQAAKATAWLERTLGVRVERIIDLSERRLVALTRVEPQPPSNWRLTVHIETFGVSDPLIPASSDLQFFANCPSRRFHVERIENFTENGDRGGQSTTFGGSEWTEARAGSLEARIVDAVCAPRTAATEIAPPEAPPVLPAPPPAPPAAIAAASPRDVSPANHASGRARVQLFAGATRDIAERFAAALPARAPLANGRPVSVEPATVRGRMVYRVVLGGLPSDSDAARLCAQFKASGQDCFVRR
jgi:hypothetical protein